jgi:uncharacterized protein YqeY
LTSTKGNAFENLYTRETRVMSLREKFPDALKSAMKARDAARTSSLRLIIARLKETDITARGKGLAEASPDEIIAMLRSMVKSRRESVELYRQGNRPELAAKEEAEIAVIESFLPQPMDEAALEAAIAAAIAESGAQGIKEMGKVMAVLKTKHGTAIDMARAGALARQQLGG